QRLDHLGRRHRVILADDHASRRLDLAEPVAEIERGERLAAARVALGVNGEQFVQVALRLGALSEGRREPAIPHAVDEGGRSLSAYRCRPVEPILAGEELRAGAAERKRLDSL